MANSRIRILSLLLALGGAGLSPAWLPGTATLAQSSKTAGVSAEKLKRPGIPNLGRVSETLYRGGQPEDEGFESLKDLGVQIVVNFRETEKAEKEERRRVEALGMKYVEIPWSGFDHPDNGQVAEFLDVLKQNPKKKVFVHCRRGAERTGVMVAAYRMVFDGWTPEQALNEMEEFKFRGLFFRHLKKYIRTFPEEIQNDPRLQAVVRVKK